MRELRQLTLAGPTYFTTIWYSALILPAPLCVAILFALKRSRGLSARPQAAPPDEPQGITRAPRADVPLALLAAGVIFGPLAGGFLGLTTLLGPWTSGNFTDFLIDANPGAELDLLYVVFAWLIAVTVCGALLGCTLCLVALVSRATFLWRGGQVLEPRANRVVLRIGQGASLLMLLLGVAFVAVEAFFVAIYIWDIIGGGA